MLRKQALQTLITEYLSSATWIYRYVDEVELNHKLERYVTADELDELTLALFFALSATTLHYIQWDHKIWRNWPEDSNVCLFFSLRGRMMSGSIRLRRLGFMILLVRSSTARTRPLCRILA